MLTILVFLVAGAVIGVGVGFTLGYYTGKRHGLRAAQRGFPVSPPAA
jgi:hypothetical protein